MGVFLKQGVTGKNLLGLFQKSNITLEFVLDSNGTLGFLLFFILKSMKYN